MTDTSDSLDADLRDLAEVFANQLATVRGQLALLRGRVDKLARIHRRLLVQQEAAWQLGIVLLRRVRDGDVESAIQALNCAGEGGHPMAQVCATMAAMVAIRRAWSTAVQVRIA
jgi:hypothetical protein